MSMDKEFLEQVRTGDAEALARMLTEERLAFHELAAEHSAESACLACGIQSFASATEAAHVVGIKQQARQVQALRRDMDAIEERIGLIRQALYRAVIAP